MLDAMSLCYRRGYVDCMTEHRKILKQALGPEIFDDIRSAAGKRKCPIDIDMNLSMGFTQKADNLTARLRYIDTTEGEK